MQKAFKVHSIRLELSGTDKLTEIRLQKNRNAGTADLAGDRTRADVITPSE